TNAGPGSPPRPGAACRRPDGFPPPGDIRTHPIAWCGNTCRPRFASTRMTTQPMESSTNCAYLGTTVPANSRFFHGRVRLSALFWAANCQSPTIGNGVEKQPHLVGQRGAATGAIGRELALVPLDQILRRAAGTIEALVHPLRSAPGDVGY